MTKRPSSAHPCMRPNLHIDAIRQSAMASLLNTKVRVCPSTIPALRSAATAAVTAPRVDHPTSQQPDADHDAPLIQDPASGKKLFVPEPIRAEQLERNHALTERIRGKLVLAPLTKGGNLPFRRLCADYGAEVTMSEMSYARQLLKGNRVDRAHMRQAENEHCYGFQIATNQISEGVAAARMAAENGASWLDLNCGCPIHEATKRGLGAVLLRKPQKLARLVAGIAAGSPIPFTVKLRIGTGEKGSNINILEVVEALQQTGAALITIHGRTMQQGYRKAADWDLIEQAAAASTIPIVGNGDVLTYYEAQRRLAGGCLAVLVGRGALIKPWIWQELREGRELQPTAAERVGIYRQLVAHMKAGFGDDALGKRKAWHFLPWHFNWFTRYRPLPKEVFEAKSQQHPLIATRVGIAEPDIGEDLDSLSLLERLLRCPCEDAYEPMAEVLWESSTDAEAVQALERLADQNLTTWEGLVQSGTSRGSSSSTQGWG